MRYRNKVTLTLLAVAGFAGGLLFAMSYFSARKVAFELIQEKVYAIAVSIAPEIDGDVHERIRTAEDDGNEDYLAIRKTLRAARDANNHENSDLPVKYVYTYRPTDKSGRKWEYVVDAEEDGSEDKSAIGDEVELGDYEEIFPSLGEAQVDTEFITDNYGTWLSAWAPIKNSAGEPVALVGVDIEAKKVSAKLRSLFVMGAVALLVALGFAAAASFILSGMVSAPLAALHHQVRLIADGDFRTRIPIESKDEFGELGEAIHGMADGLKEREAFKEALVRFVSSGTADSVIDEESGDDGARRVTVVLTALRNFEVISKALPPDQVFSFLSDWYSTVIDTILTNRGAIEKSSGPSMTATFGAPINDPDQERHAIEAALTLQQNFTRLCRQWKLSEDSGLSLDATIHTGQVTVTGKDHASVMELASLERIIGVASLIQSAAQSASADGIIISETTEKGLRGTIPLSYLRSVEIGKTGELLSIHQAEMPTPPAN